MASRPRKQHQLHTSNGIASTLKNAILRGQDRAVNTFGLVMGAAGISTSPGVTP